MKEFISSIRLISTTLNKGRLNVWKYVHFQSSLNVNTRGDCTEKDNKKYTAALFICGYLWITEILVFLSGKFHMGSYVPFGTVYPLPIFLQVALLVLFIFTIPVSLWGVFASLGWMIKKKLCRRMVSIFLISSLVYVIESFAIVLLTMLNMARR